MDNSDAEVYGEPVDALLPALIAFRDSMKERPDGRWAVSLTLPPEVAAPLWRALMRAEAELLLEDADALRTPQDVERTPDERRADVLARLVLALPQRA